MTTTDPNITASDDTSPAKAEENENRFRILVCIDGSDESYNTLRYAAKLGRGVEADICLLYVRPMDKGMRSGGLNVRVARENMLNWGLELPGIRYLKKGRDLLIEHGHMGEDWEEKATHVDVEGDPLGDNKIEYTNAQGKRIILKLKVAPDIASGILAQWEIARYDLIILGASGRWQGMAKAFWDPAIAEKVAIHAPCSVIVARSLEAGHGHLICTDGSEKAQDMVIKDGMLASRCQCPISLMSVSMDEESLDVAERAVADGAKVLKEKDIDVAETITAVGNPIEQIIETGANYSLIVLSDTGKTRLQRFFMGSVAFKVMSTAHNSVMIVR